MLDVQDKVVAITGAVRGLGQEFAVSLTAGGARIVAGDINDCAETLDLVGKAGREGIGVKLDVTDAASAQAMIEAGLRAFGPLDALLNNAAPYRAPPGGPLDAIPAAGWGAPSRRNGAMADLGRKRVCDRPDDRGRWRHCDAVKEEHACSWRGKRR